MARPVITITPQVARKLWGDADTIRRIANGIPTEIEHRFSDDPYVEGFLRDTVTALKEIAGQLQEIAASYSPEDTNAKSSDLE